MKKDLLIQEIDSMIRTLDFIQEGQSFIKHKLSSLLDNLVMHDLLEWSEQLHQEILNREIALQILRRDIIKLSNFVINNKEIGDLIDTTVVAMYQKCKQQVVYFELQYFTWKNVIDDQFDHALN